MKIRFLKSRDAPTARMPSRRFQIFIGLFLVVAAVIFSEIAWTAPPPDPEWIKTLSPPIAGKFPPPRPQRAFYHFGWSALAAADAEFAYAKMPASQLQLTVKTKTIGAVRAMWRMDAEHVALCQTATLRPIRLVQTVVYKAKTEYTKADFDAHGVERCTIEKPASDVPPKKRRFNVASIFDLQTAVLFIRSQRLQTGEKYRLLVYPAKAGYLADVAVAGREKIKIHGQMRDAIKCELRLQGLNKKMQLEPDRKFKHAYAWFSDDSDRLLLRAEAEIYLGSVWAELDSVEFLPAAPR